MSDVSNAIEDGLGAVADSIQRVSHGGVMGPTGLELLAMSLAEKNEPTVSDQLGAIASAIHRLAQAVEER